MTSTISPIKNTKKNTDKSWSSLILKTTTTDMTTTNEISGSYCDCPCEVCFILKKK